MLSLQASTATIIFFVTAVTILTLLQLLIWGRDTAVSTHKPSLSWLAGVFVAFVGSVIFVGWVGVLLVTVGAFSLLNVTILITVAAVGLGVWQRPFTLPSFLKIDRIEMALLVLMAGAAIVYFRPHEYVLGGIDPGVYVNMAATAVRTGDFFIEDEWTTHLAQFPEVTLREQPAEWRTRFIQFVGWYIDDEDPSRLIPQFFPYHAMLLAVGMSLGGLYAGLLVTPLWGVLGITAVYLVGKQIFNPTVGFLAALLLAITPTHIYFARYPTTEPLTLLLIFTGLYAFQKLWDTAPGGRLWGMLLGGAFGAAFLTRIDLPLVALVLAGFFVLRWWQKRWNKGWTTAVLVTAFLSAHAGLSSWVLNAPYSWNTYGSVARLLARSSLVVGLAVVGVVGLLGTAVIIWRIPWHTFRQSRAGRMLNSSQMRWMVVLVVVGLSLFAYFVRPILQPPTVYASWPTGADAFALDGENWVRLGWYITPLGLLLATVGACLVLLKDSLNRLGFFLLMGGLTVVQYVYRIFNTPYHIYAMRRYVPIVIPVLMIMTAVTLYTLLRQKERRLAWLSGGTAVMLMVGGLLFQSRAVLPLRDLEGATEQLITLSEALQPDALILINEPPTQTFADTVGPPLRFLFGHEIATVRQGGEAARPFINEMVAYAVENERPLQLLAIGPIDPILEEAFLFEPVAFLPIRVPKLLNTYTDYPTTLQTVYYGIELYNLTPVQLEAASQNGSSITIDVGAIDSLYLVDGFYGKEPLGNESTVRWTAAEATMEIPTNGAERVTIDIAARIFRPEGVAPAPVMVIVDGQHVGEFVPQRPLTTYTFTADVNTSQSSSTLQFKTTPFNPAALNLSADQRDLGFVLDWVKVTVEEQ